MPAAAPRSPDPNSSQLRPFRALALGTYMFLIAVFVTLVVVSVVKSVWAMSPSRPPAQAQVLTVTECISLAEKLWSQLEEGRRALTNQPSARGVDVEWSSFRVQWMQKLRRAEADCALDAKGRAPLRTAFRQLEKVQDLYTTHAVQFAREIGES